MPEINAELNIIVNSEVVHLLTGNANADRIIIEPITLTKEQAATLAWLNNHPKGTQLELQLKRK
jgi:hypothetical protein